MKKIHVVMLSDCDRDEALAAFTTKRAALKFIDEAGFKALQKNHPEAQTLHPRGYWLYSDGSPYWINTLSIDPTRGGVKWISWKANYPYSDHDPKLLKNPTTFIGSAKNKADHQKHGYLKNLNAPKPERTLVKVPITGTFGRPGGFYEYLLPLPTGKALDEVVKPSLFDDAEKPLSAWIVDNLRHILKQGFSVSPHTDECESRGLIEAVGFVMRSPYMGDLKYKLTRAGRKFLRQHGAGRKGTR